MTNTFRAKDRQNRLKLLQVMASRQRGGAEAFFSRLCTALAEAHLDQQAVVRTGAACLDELREAGIPTIELPFLFTHDAMTRQRLSSVIEKYAPQVVLTWMSRASALCPKGPFRHVGRLGGYYDLKYYSTCHYLIANTVDIADYAVRGGWPRERVRYLPNFVDESPATPIPRTSFGTPVGAPIILALGRLHQHKAFDVQIRALVRLAEVHLWLAGEGPQKHELHELAQSLGVADRVHFLGWRADVGSLLKTADCLVCPSRVEPLGNVILEAWMHGCPVVAADSTGPKGLIDPEKTALLVPKEDADALASAIGRVLNNRRLATDLCKNAAEAYRAGFTRQAVVARYIEFLSEVAT